MAEHNDKGAWGEDVAVQYLVKQGYKILTRNYVFEKAEIDVIAEKDNLLVIVEVKTRSSLEFGLPSDAITNKKMKLIIHATEAYINKNEIDLETRFDVVCVVAKSPPEIEHIIDAFYPTL